MPVVITLLIFKLGMVIPKTVWYTAKSEGTQQSLTKSSKYLSLFIFIIQYVFKQRFTLKFAQISEQYSVSLIILCSQSKIIKVLLSLCFSRCCHPFFYIPRCTRRGQFIIKLVRYCLGKRFTFLDKILIKVLYIDIFYGSIEYCKS